MLELKGVHTHYGLSHVLQGIDLQVGHGEVVGLFGRNGVGKTTVIKTIAGWVSPSSGDVIFNGESINGVGADQICRRGIGLVPEDRRIFPGLTVEENLHLGQMQCPSRSRLDARRRMRRAGRVQAQGQHKEQEPQAHHALPAPPDAPMSAWRVLTSQGRNVPRCGCPPFRHLPCVHLPGHVVPPRPCVDLRWCMTADALCDTACQRPAQARAPRMGRQAAVWRCM